MQFPGPPRHISLHSTRAAIWRLVAPDYPGFGHSDWPDAKDFAYTFDHIASVMEDFTQTLGLARYTLYMQDHGGPVGFRMVLAHPERVQALIALDTRADDIAELVRNFMKTQK